MSWHTIARPTARVDALRTPKGRPRSAPSCRKPSALTTRQGPSVLQPHSRTSTRTERERTSPSVRPPDFQDGRRINRRDRARVRRSVPARLHQARRHRVRTHSRDLWVPSRPRPPRSRRAPRPVSPKRRVNPQSNFPPPAQTTGPSPSSARAPTAAARSSPPLPCPAVTPTDPTAIPGPPTPPSRTQSPSPPRSPTKRWTRSSPWRNGPKPRKA